MVKALFLDRDGVICKATPRGTYLTKLEEFELLDGVHVLVTTAKERGYVVAVITNQPQVGKGLLSKEGLDVIHGEMQKQLGGMIDKIYVCTHRADENCSCRKPKPGMLFDAQRDFEIDFSHSLFVGDSDKDVGAGKAVAVKTVFLKNEHNALELARCEPGVVISSLLEVVALL